MSKLRYNSQVEKSLANLRAMGLTVNVIADHPDEVNIFITLDSIMKLIERRINFPQKEVYMEQPFMVVRLWRG